MSVTSHCMQHAALLRNLALFLPLTLASGAFGNVAPAAADPPSENVVPDSGAYEKPPLLNASELLPAYLLSGDVFAVDEVVRNDGETNHYTVRSPFGDVTAAGRDEVERVIQELRAIEYLRAHRKRTGAVMGFNQGAKKVAMAPYRSVKRVAFDPLYAIEAVPTEIADYASKIATVSDLVKYGPRVFIRRSLGIDGARDDLADRLHVDDQTENDVLRREINRVGWGVWMGGLAPDIGEAYIDLSLDLSTEVGNAGEGNLGRSVAVLRREVVPRTARRMLRKMDVPKAQIQAFRAHPHFSGRMRERLAEALVTMEETEGRTTYVDWAMAVESGAEARQAVRLAQVMAVHHDREEPVSRIQSLNDVLVFETANEKFVAPHLHDYLIWSESAADRIELAETLRAETAPSATMEVWSTGEFSPRMRAELTARGHGVRTDVDADYPPFARPRKGLKRYEQRYQQQVAAPLREQLRPDRPQRLVLEPLGPDNPDSGALPATAATRPAVTFVEEVEEVEVPREARYGRPGDYPVDKVVRHRLHGR